MKKLIGQSVDSLDTPVLIVELNALNRNIDKMSSTIISEAGVGWRPHTKSMKNPDLAKLCLKAGAHGITCAKLGEAEVMASAGINDILVANQIVGSKKISRLIELSNIADVKVCVDNIENVKEIDSFARKAKKFQKVLIEIDVGFGRTGITPRYTLEFAKKVKEYVNINLVGLQAWEAHTLKIKDPIEKKGSILKALSLLSKTANTLNNNGIKLEIISCGGTGTYWISAFAPGITEIEAGGGIYGCNRYRRVFGVELEPALTILSTVTSRPALNRIVCDSGFKTTGKGFGEPELINFGEIKSFEFSAEHGMITLVDENSSVSVGDRIEFVPAYSDATVFLHEYIYGIRNNVIETVWPVIGRGKLH